MIIPIWFLTNSTGKPHQQIYGTASDQPDRRVFFDLRPDQRSRSLGQIELSEGQLCIVGTHDQDFNKKEYLRRKHRKKFEWWMLKSEEGPVLPSEKKKSYRKFFQYKGRDSFEDPHLFYRGLKLWEDYVGDAEPYSASSPYAPLLKEGDGAAKSIFILQQDMYPYKRVDLPEALLNRAIADFPFLSFDSKTGLLGFNDTSFAEPSIEAEVASAVIKSNNSSNSPKTDIDENDLDEDRGWIAEHRELVEKTLFAPQRDPYFRSRIFASHGAKCAVCSIVAIELLQAAHLRGVADGGSDHAGNGIPLCANHHLGLDAGLWVIDPDTREVELVDRLHPEDIGIQVSRIELDLCYDDLAHRYERFIGLM